MTTFFLDLWHDLREKRLWPVAAGLTLAIVVVPIALSKSTSAPPPSSDQPIAQKGDRLPAVSLDQHAVATSHLNVFKERNPFKDLADKTSVPGAGGSTIPGTGASSGVSGSAGAGSSPFGGGGSSSSTGGASTASSGGVSGGSSSTPVAPNGKPATPGAHYYVFTADVRFGAVGHVHTYNGVKALSLLPPDSKSKVLSFYDVETGGKRAVFFNYKGFDAVGEGKCLDSCLMVALKPGQEETFTAGTTAYTLKLLAIHTRELSKDQAVGSASPDKAKNAKVSKSSKHETLLSLPRLEFRL